MFLFSEDNSNNPMISRIDAFFGNGGMYVRKVSVEESKVAPGLYKFLTKYPEDKKLEEIIEEIKPMIRSTVKIDSVFGIAYGNPGLYVGTLQDLDKNEKYFASILFVKSEQLSEKMLNIEEAPLENYSIYLARIKIYKDNLYSEDLEPHHFVAFRGVKYAPIQP